ncbi:hypothetical protein VN12_12205 [Pirellula sp. SH-Sr6A]|uniref:hypothetical protein n=1 Tax=Pirellula sp. SH-Sr6A TaxID=1632865 RepID=UPI00078C6147|nr:hypothetical protein [Pirellula sp. SH-Sr6A]AMV32881.1 hypothetical protein VN12_12205 [Pirellula sp. SH-Sr6A]
MKKIWFHGLALSLGMSTLPSMVQAQYAGQSQYGGANGGLSPSSFQLPPLPGQGTPAAPRAAMGSPSTSQPQNAMVSYAQQGGTIGSGALDPYSHVPLPPAPPATAPGKLPMPNATPEPYTLGQPLPYELSPAPQHSAPQYPNPQYQGEVVQPSAVPAYSGDGYSSQLAPSGSDSGCPTCATGNCSVHGGNSTLLSPAYGLGGSSDAYCETAPTCGPSIVSPNPWIFGAGALIFTRIDDAPVRLTSDSNMPTYPLLTTADARMRTSGGVQGSVGRYFGCGRFALVGTYWGIYNDEQSTVITPPPGGNLRSDLPFTLRRPGDTATPGDPYGITMPAQNVYDWYDMAAAHRIRRDSEFHNVELNLFSFALGGGARQAYADCGTGGHCGLLGRGGMGADACGTSCAPTTGPTGPCAPWYGAQCSRLRLSMFGGVRWFRFGDDLEYATSENDTMFGGADDFYYRNNVTNDLVGFQLGTLATWCTGKRVNLYGSTAFGVYNNHIRAATFAGTTTQAATVMSASSTYDGREYAYDNSTNDIAFLGEGTLGTGICLWRGWSANCGYRVVAVSGVATAVGQIPRDFSNGLEISKISNDRSLILHGAVLGLNYNF